MSEERETSPYILDPETIIRKARDAVPPRSDAVRPDGTEAMWVRFIKQREEFHVQLRLNIISISAEILADPKNWERAWFRKEHREYERKRSEEVRAWAEAEPDMSKGDIFHVSREEIAAMKPGEDDYLFMHDPPDEVKYDSRVEIILNRHEVLAKAALGKYRKQLKRTRNWNNAMKKIGSHSKKRTSSHGLKTSPQLATAPVSADAAKIDSKEHKSVERIRYKDGARIINKEADAAWGETEQVMGRPKKQALVWW